MQHVPVRAVDVLVRWRHSPVARYRIALLLTLVLLLMLARSVTPQLQDASKPQIRFGVHAAEAEAHVANSRWREAAASYRRAIAELSEGPEASRAFNNLGWALQQMGRVDEAADAYRTAAALDPTFTLPRGNLAAVQSIGPP